MFCQSSVFAMSCRRQNCEARFHKIYPSMMDDLPNLSFVFFLAKLANLLENLTSVALSGTLIPRGVL